MRPAFPLLLVLALGSGCGSESAPNPGVPQAERAEESPGRDALPALKGRAEGVAATRARLQGLATLEGLQANERVREAFLPEDLEILRSADVVRLIVGDPIRALGEDEIAEGVDPVAVEATTPIAEVTRAGDREEIAFRVLRSVAGSDGSGARCFHPEQTIRFCRGGRCVEVEICLRCRRLVVVPPGGEEPRWATLDGSLRPALVGLCRRYGLSADAAGCGG